MSRLRAHLADAETAAAGHDRSAATSALDALGYDVAVLQRSGRISKAQAAVLMTDVAQAHRRAQIELPAPPAPTPPPATTATAAAPAPPPPPAPAPAVAQPPPGAKDHGKGKDHGNGKDHGKHGHGGD